MFTTARPANSCIPQGARLIGQYDSQIAFGQSRVLLVWNRIIMPNGKSIVLERQSGADAEGYAGLEDDVDYHWGSFSRRRSSRPARRRHRARIEQQRKRLIARAIRQAARTRHQR
jgi:hypothetical protein